jgi:hypothetical protein
MRREAGRQKKQGELAKYVEPLFEAKTVLEKNEGDNGMPTLFERHVELAVCCSVLRGKFDNVYDMPERMSDGFQ